MRQEIVRPDKGRSGHEERDLVLQRDSETSVYTVEETAKLLRIGRSAAYEAVRRGQIPALRLGRRLRVPRCALEKLLNGSVQYATPADGGP